MKKTILFFLLSCPSWIIAQNLESCISVIASGGANTEINGLSYTYTIGELAIATFENPPRIISQGFNQPDCGLIVSTTDLSIAEKWGVSLFPNPSSDNLNIKFIHRPPTVLNYSILNENGQVIGEDLIKMLGSQAKIEIEDFPSGIYFLQLESPEEEKSLSVPFIKI